MKNYGSTEENENRATEFVNKASRPKQQPCCCQNCCPSPALVVRFIIRTSIPLIFGIMAGIGIKWINEMINGPEVIIASSKNNTLLEVSDIISCCTTLIVTYSIDCLLNRCWPVHPYRNQSSAFFRLTPKNDDVDKLELDKETNNLENNV